MFLNTGVFDSKYVTIPHIGQFTRSTRGSDFRSAQNRDEKVVVTTEYRFLASMSLFSGLAGGVLQSVDYDQPLIFTDVHLSETSVRHNSGVHAGTSLANTWCSYLALHKIGTDQYRVEIREEDEDEAPNVIFGTGAPDRKSYRRRP